MAITVYDESQVLSLALFYLQQAYPGKPIGPKSFLGQQARALAQLVGSIQQAILAADNDGVPAYDTASAVIRSRCSSQALDNWAVTFGLPSNKSAAALGRNGPVAATGGSAPVTGAPGTIFVAGALLTDGAGQIQIELISGLVLPGGGSLTGSFQAVAAGADGNLPAGTRLRWVSPPPGATPTVTLATALSGGYDKESDQHLLERLITHLRNPPKGGTAHDYRVWAEESTDSLGKSIGIVRAYVYPHRDGLGSEDVVLTIGGSGKSRDPGALKRTQAQTYLDAIRPVNDGPRAIRPYFNNDRGLRIVLQVVPTAAYPWDWTMVGSAALFNGSTASVLRITAAGIPAGLAQAIADGTTPRIQIVLPESPVPQVRQIVARQDLIGIANLTLDTPLTSAPGFGTEIWPAGGHVVPVGVAVGGYLDNVGPSQQSGFQDKITDSWEAIVSVGKIAWAALDAEDDIGDKVLVYAPGVGQGVGVKIGVGAGPLAAADVPLFDNWPAEGPELPWATSILVLPVQ